MPDIPSAAVSNSIHGEFLQQAIPDWLTQATPERRNALKDAPARLPDGYKTASVEQLKALKEATVASFDAQTQLDKAVAGLQDIDSFARPLLVKALHDRFNLQLDVDHTFLLLRQPVEVGIFSVDIGHFEVLKLPLLQAALHNFEASECAAGAFHASSRFLLKDPTSGELQTLSTALTVEQFTGLCRALDIGAKYQDYLKGFLRPDDQALRDTFIRAQKTALRAALELALLQKDIEPADYPMILSVINGEKHPQLGGKPVWFRDLSLMNHRMTGCVMFAIGNKYRHNLQWILYIPHEPHAPLKRFTEAEMARVFKQRFTDRDRSLPDDGSPTAYQRFFSRFVAYADRADYFDQLTDTGSTTLKQTLGPYLPLLNDLAKGINTFSIFTGIKTLPPTSTPPKIANDDPYLAPSSIPFKAHNHGKWSDNLDLWDYLFERHRDQLIADGRAHAVPTADVDARVRSQKFSSLLNIGMLALTFVSMFIPVFGEIMLAVMAAQLLNETFEGVLEWTEGNRKAAKAHLFDVAQNLVLLAVTAGAGKGLAKLAAVKAEPVVEALEPVIMPDGQERLWQPDLAGYAATVELKGAPDALGQYQVEGKSYIRLGDHVVETTFDESAQHWRIKHPSDPHAYQPPLSHNGAGAWRYLHERPLAWDRLTLLRRMGPRVGAYSDEQLLRIGEVSGVSDNALRKMHVDNALPPPELADTLRQFEAGQGVQRVLAQLEGTQPIDEHYLYAPALVTELPRWPAGRVLQVFEQPDLLGVAVKYGGERLPRGFKAKAPVRISRDDVLGGQLAERILESLDEGEITRLLGGEPARVKEARPQAFRTQLADFARTRQPALFDSLYHGQAPRDPRVHTLQRLTPGLSESAARTVLDHASAEELARLDNGRAPLHLLEQSRWYARQGRISRAHAGLYLDAMTSTDSKRLALHALSKLPGWSDALRLEIREGGLEGRMIDAIGREDAPQRQYLIKRGPFYQAFDERGEALNSVPPDSDNFYASLMHALPDDARRDLGVFDVDRSAELRQAIVDQALAHSAEAPRVLGQRLPRPKPPRRISEKLVGYLASGRGEGQNPRLVSRVKDVYTQLTSDQALDFILAQQRLGKNDQQIFSLLNNRMREYQRLEATLEDWVRAPGLNGNGKRAVAEGLKDCWRSAPLAASPRYGTLQLWVNDPLPTLEADFSHVRDLTVGGYGFSDANINALLDGFPNVSRLRLSVQNVRLRAVPAALERMTELVELNLQANIQFEPEECAKLANLVKLQVLRLDHVLNALDHLDIRRMTDLRELSISRTLHGAFPEATLQLPHLERLNLMGTRVARLPERLFEPGHERLWSGLSLDWSMIGRESFKRAYAFVSNHPQHLVDQDLMVKTYAKAEILRMSGADPDLHATRMQRAETLFHTFASQWTSTQAGFEAIEALSDEYGALARRLYEWMAAERLPAKQMLRSRVISNLRSHWFEGVLKRYDVAPITTVVDIAGLEFDDLPDLSEHNFDHIQTVRLKKLRAPIEQVRRFVRGFRETTLLDLSNSAVTDTPVAPGDLPSLHDLNLSFTPLGHLDVSSMHNLNMLKLQGSLLSTWPVGAEALTQLDWLDLRHADLTDVSAAALASDTLVLSVNLTGTRLTPQARLAVEAAQRRVEFAHGLPAGTLERFAHDMVPYDFPLEESSASILGNLLPMPEAVAAGEGDAWLVQRLRRIDPSHNEETAAQTLEHLRSQGLGALEINNRLQEWHQTLVDLTSRLNGWLYIRTTRGPHWTVSAGSRRLAAWRILKAWRAGLRPLAAGAEHHLELNGLQLGDLPPLTADFSHISHLDLSGVLLSEQGSDGFLRAFTGLRSLYLSGQSLQALPSAIGGMSQLQELRLASTGLVNPQVLYSALSGLERLRTLDLATNNLRRFDLHHFPRLEALDLRHNLMTDWPAGTLESAHLRTLNLSGNDIESIPESAFDGSHDLLMQHTDLSNCDNLSLDSLQRLREFADRTGYDQVLGIPASELDGLIDAFASEDSESSSEEEDENHAAQSPAVQPDEVLVVDESGSRQRALWLNTLLPEQAAVRQTQWQQLAGEPENLAFFHLLASLEACADFKTARADLTRRVWTVIEAATENTELREQLFAASNTHGTCEDGRILTFSNLEVHVFVYRTLLEIDPLDMDARGAALLRLSRRLFRLDRVEKLADDAAQNVTDKAEVRLEYRLGLKDALDLPGQPVGMLYGFPIRGHTLEAAVQAVRAAEQGDLFYEDLIRRTYWTDYLTEKYPEPFVPLEQRKAQRRAQLENEHTILDENYQAAVTMLDIDLSIERNQLLLQLSRQEVAAQEALAA